ncbi:hypothetical protein RYX36_005732 [Vicia faba]
MGLISQHQSTCLLKNRPSQPAFLKSWQVVCDTTQGAPTFIIPQNKTLMLQPLSFQGPCKSTIINIKIMGTSSVPKISKNWKWVNNDHDELCIKFDSINGLVINGGGNIDDQGALDGGQVIDQRPKNHISITSCNGVLLSRLRIIAPENSPNTDEIDISTSINMLVEKSTISTGDDCIAIKSGFKLINITSINYGYGHGIRFATVEEVHVRNIAFKGPTNGARIKTWVGGSYYAIKITYEDIKFIGVKNPVIIDQHYDAYNVLSNTRNVDIGSKAVKVSDVTF